MQVAGSSPHSSLGRVSQRCRPPPPRSSSSSSPPHPVLFIHPSSSSPHSPFLVPHLSRSSLSSPQSILLNSLVTHYCSLLLRKPRHPWMCLTFSLYYMSLSETRTSLFHSKIVLVTEKDIRVPSLSLFRAY